MRGGGEVDRRLRAPVADAMEAGKGAVGEVDPHGRRLAIEGCGHDPVSGLLMEAVSPAALLVLGHGAGAPMTHPFMEELARALARRGISTLRYNFAYVEAGRRRPDPVRRLLAVVDSALRAGRECAGDLPLFAGGKSMGGRMTSMLIADRAIAASLMARNSDGVSSPPAASGSGPLPEALEIPSGLVFFGFPLHPAGRPASERGDHLDQVPCPMLFHQGTRDRLADRALIGELNVRLAPRSTLHSIHGGDHSFTPLKRLGRTLDEILADVAALTRLWTDRVAATKRAAP